ncbi:MAG: glutamate-cysteine ligase family protein [Saprospiraceae bacterium]
MNIYKTFTKQFQTKQFQKKQVGLEVELPFVQQLGEAIDYSLIQFLFLYLEKQGFQLVKDNNTITEATIVLTKLSKEKVFVTTDLGYSTLEIILPPFNNLYLADQCFKTIINYLLPFVNKHNCHLLGYGVHPLSLPSRRLLAPQQRYKGLEKIWKTNKVVPRSMGNDAHLLTVSAGNQCHVDVSETEAIHAVNVLNASSGLQIALQANSPIWQGKIVKGYKAIREFFYDYLHDKAFQRHGVTPKFETLNQYFEHIYHQKLFLIIRNGKVLQINDYDFATYMEEETVIGTQLNGEPITVTPNVDDIHYHNTLCYFNARLVPKYGTIEVRMPCQQPPNETMVTAALNLGLMENLKEAEAYLSQYDWETWQYLRTEAIKHTFDAKLPNGESIVPLIENLLIIAKSGLDKRGLNEAVFLNPLFERLEQRKSPADKAINIFNQKGINGLLNLVRFTEFETETATPYSVLTSIQ